jgi:hypothetical protein
LTSIRSRIQVTKGDSKLRNTASGVTEGLGRPERTAFIWHKVCRIVGSNASNRLEDRTLCFGRCVQFLYGTVRFLYRAACGVCKKFDWTPTFFVTVNDLESAISPEQLASALPTKGVNQCMNRAWSEEGRMEAMQGKICEILPETADDVFALVLAGGLEVLLPQKWGRKVLDVVSLGSDLEICGYAFCGLAGDPCVNAQFITNLTSRRSLSLREIPASPEASPCSPTPVGATPLAPPFAVVAFEQPEDERAAVPCSYPSSTPLLGNISHNLKLEQHCAPASVEALIAYVRILDLELPDLTHLMEESKQTYEQAVASYERHECLVANEFADASVDRQDRRRSWFRGFCRQTHGIQLWYRTRRGIRPWGPVGKKRRAL